MSLTRALPALLTALLLTTLTAPAHATPPAGPAPAASPRLAIDRALTSGAGGMAALREGKASFERVLVVERLPTNDHAIAEAAFRHQGRELRLPLKLRRVVRKGCAPGWVVTWAPHKAYVEGLLALLTSDTLPAQITPTPWVATARLPALPVLLTKKRMITPLGPLDQPKGVDQTVALTGVEALDPPLLLVQHATAWTRHIIERDDAPAAFDVIADGRVSWLRFQRVLIGLASQGFYRVNLITRHQRTLYALQATAPVFGDLPGDEAGKPVPLVIAHARAASGAGAALRISVGGKLIISDSAACAPKAAACVASPAQLPAALSAALAEVPADQRQRLRFATFATEGDTTLSDALPWLNALAPALKVPQQRVFLTIIRGAAR